MSSICAICQLENPENSHFWKEHHITEANYYLKYFPKKDLLTQEILPFKNRDSYLLTDFFNKHNQKKWLKSQNTETRQKYLKQLLINRRELKKWSYIPTQVELRSCPELVGIKTFNETFKEGYYNLCTSIGYTSRAFQNINQKTILKPLRSLRGNPIIIDSREQTFLKFNDKVVEINTLAVGDYTIKNNNFNIHIERKSLNDLTSTFGPKNFDRFRRELIKAQELGIYLILLVENDFNTVLEFDHSPFLSKHTQMTAIYLFHQIRILLQEFPNWQIGFCNNRTEMKDLILKIFEMNDYWKYHDLQLALDLKLFTEGI